MTFNPGNSLGPFLPINQTFSQNEGEFHVQITNRDRDIARNINDREIALYDLAEVPTGQQWFNSANTQVKRNGYRKAFILPAITSGNSLSLAHNIVGITIMTRYWANVITDVPDFRQIPYASNALATDQVAMRITSTDILIAVGVAFPNITSGIAVLEYLKS